MKGANLVSVIVPCFNENKRILPVVEAILASEIVDEIVVVDDGSKEDTKKVLRSLPTKVRVISHPQNMGKAAAMKTGLLNSKGGLILFVDSDLRGFTKEHIEQLVKPVRDSFFDMVLGIRQYDVFYARWFNLSAPYSGERCFRRDVLMKNLKIFENEGYLVEASMNKVYFGNYRVGKILMKGVSQTAKVKKNGLRGLLSSMQMSNTIVKFVGLSEALSQIIFVKRLPWILSDR